MKEKVVLFASPKDGKLVKTHLRIYAELLKRGVEVCSIDCRTAKVLDNGKVEGKVAKEDGKRIVDFDPSVTACVVSNGIVGNKSSSEFVEDLEEMGVYVINSLKGIENARDKESYDRICKKSGIPTPKTRLVNSPKELDEVLPEFEFPVVCKTTTGSLGVGVFKIDKPSLVKPIFQAMWKVSPDLKNEGILIQEFLKNKGDVRTIVVGGEIIGSMKRIAAEGDFRNNFSQGGTVEQYDLNAEEKETVLKAAKVSGCEICGVDHIVGQDGKPYIIEVNSCPGTDGFLTVHPDAIERMADYILSKCGSTTKTNILGSVEKVDIEEIGELPAQFDMGEREHSILDARNIDVDGNTVKFESNGRTISLPVIDWATYMVNGSYKKVPVVRLDVKLKDTNLNGVQFELVNREKKQNPVLISKNALSGHKFLIDPSRNGLLKESVEEPGAEPAFDSVLSNEALVCLFSLTQKGRREDKPITPAAMEELGYRGFVEDGKPTKEGWEFITSKDTIDRLMNLRNGVEA